jgi:uroporphyrinogen-III synthase
MPVILLTRPADGAARFAKALTKRLGEAPIIISPILEITPTTAKPDLSDDPLIVFTSRNGVAHCGFPPKPGQQALCVGDATAAMAQAAGFETRSASGDVEDLIRMLRDEAPKRPLLHLRGRHSAGDLVSRLRQSGIDAHETVVYDQAALALTDKARATLNGEGAVIVPLFSPRTAKEFSDKGPWHAPLFVSAISAATADAAPAHPDKMQIASEPTQAAMVDATCGLFDAAQSLEGGMHAQ